MGFALLVIFMFVAYGLTTLCRRWIDVPTLLGVAIGCAVNANLYTSLTHPVAVGPFTFSAEIVLYTLFMYTVIIRVLDYSYEKASYMTLTSIAAIIISAVIELFALLSIGNDVVETLKTFSYYIFSCIGTIAGVWLMILITVKCRAKGISSYLIIPFAIIASSLVHAFVYYGGYAIVNIGEDAAEYTIERILFSALSTMIGKAVCIGLSMFCYFINQKFWRPINLVSKEKEGENK